MATSTISHTVTDGSGVTVGAGHLVEALLQPGHAFRSSDNTGIARRVTTTTNSSGGFALPLERQANIVTPSGTWWKIIIHLPPSKGGPQTYAISVGAADALLHASIVHPSASTGLSTYLTQAVADGRYLAGNFALGFVDVKRDHGAVGNGIADDTAAFQSAINAIKAAGGGILFVPKGTYRITGTLEIHDFYGLDIWGAAMDATCLEFDPSTTGDSMFSFRNTGALSMRNCQLICDAIDDDAIALDFDYTAGNPLYRIRFDNVEVNRFWKAGRVTGTAMCDGVKFVGCRFASCYYGFEVNNQQAVNWQFVETDFERVDDDMVTVKALQDGAHFWLKTGAGVSIFGGSVIGSCALVLYDAASTTSSRASHHVIAIGTRFEMVAGGAKNRIFRQGASAVITGNSIAFTLRDTPVYFRGAASDFHLCEVRNKWLVTLDRVSPNQISTVMGFVDDDTLTFANAGDLRIPSLDTIDSVVYRRDVSGLTGAGTAMHRIVTARKTAAAIAGDSILAHDSFRRADSASTLTDTEDGRTWTAHQGTWGILGNRGTVRSTSGGTDVASFDAGTGNGSYSVNIQKQTGSTPGIVFRLTDGDDFLLLSVNSAGTDLTLAKRVAGVDTVLTTTNTFPLTNGFYNRWRIDVRNDLIRVFVDDVYISALTHTLSAGDLTAFPTTKHRWGLFSVNDTITRFKDLTLRTLE